jgi:hypothetical protein
LPIHDGDFTDVIQFARGSSNRSLGVTTETSRQSVQMISPVEDGV